jgi:hypothetical protein
MWPGPLPAVDYRVTVDRAPDSGPVAVAVAMPGVVLS